jgi:hypothetical protein
MRGLFFGFQRDRNHAEINRGFPSAPQAAGPFLYTTGGRYKSMSSTYADVLRILDDGQWHAVDELASVSRYPVEWARELRHDGHQVVADPSGALVVRLVRHEQRVDVREHRAS